MASTAPPVRTAAGVIIPTGTDDGRTSERSLVLSAALTVAAIAGLAILSVWYAPIAFLAAGAGAGYSLSGSV